MQKMKEELKEKYNINLIHPFSDIILKKHKVRLFHSNTLDIKYSVYTDGSIEHIDTWVDKNAYQHDIFLDDCYKVKRFDFLLSDANFILFDKRYDCKHERVLYLDFSTIDNVNLDKIYNLSINDKQNIKIKRLEL